MNIIGKCRLGDNASDIKINAAFNATTFNVWLNDKKYPYIYIFLASDVLGTMSRTLRATPRPSKLKKHVTSVSI